jgi:hypothetical protein
MFEPTRTIDWVMLVVEGLVLVLILYEVVVGEIRHRGERRRRQTVGNIVLELSRLMDKGRWIQSSVPDPSIMNPQLVEPWRKSAQAWIEETNAFLASHSSRASSAFMLVTDAGNMDSVVKSGGRQFALTGEFREFYQRFAAGLANLRRILEQADAYF